MIETILIWATLAVLAYCYAFYPVLILVSSKFFKRTWKQDPTLSPTVSVILAVFNEELVIESCLNGLLKLEYPVGSIEILVGSDGSDDGTEALLQKYSESYPQIRAFCFKERRGKIPVVNDLVAAAKGDILFFTDADVIISPKSIWEHTKHYASEQIGGVAGNLVLAGVLNGPKGPLGSEQYYMSVENVLRKHEAELHSTVGIFGGHYSIRKSLWKQLPNEPICDELFIGLTIIESGRRMVFETRAIASEYFGRSMSDEFKRKSRFASRGLNTLRHFPGLLSPFAGWPAVMLWSHKVIRWLTPFCLLVMLCATVYGSLAGYHTSHYRVLLLVEIASALVVLAGAAFSRVKKDLPLLPHAYWFVTMNVAFALGTIRFLFNREQKFWSQSTRVKLATTLPDAESSADSVSPDPVMNGKGSAMLQRQVREVVDR